MKTFTKQCHCIPSSDEEWIELLNFARSCGVPIENYKRHLNRTTCKSIEWNKEIQTTFRTFGKEITVEEFKEYCTNWKTILALNML